MYIYLDESYNLKDRDKEQFISINGFLVLDKRPVFKEWKKIRKPFAKGGIVEQVKYEKELFDFVKSNFPGTIFNFKSQPSTTVILLELADFISNILYRAYQTDDIKFLNSIVHKLIQLKNPLKNNGPFR